MSGKTPIFVSRPGPIIPDPVIDRERYSGPISVAERERLQPLTTAVLKRRETNSGT